VSAVPARDDDLAARREQMIRQQIERRGVRDARVLAALRRVPRHRFLPAGRRGEAYADHPVPIGSGQTISQPYIVALMTECLALTGGGRVLEVGTGSGYQTAVLAEIADEVYTVERLPELTAQAEARLAGLGYDNVRFRSDDGTLGWPEAAPFAGIMVTAGAPRVPAELLAQLGEGGRLVIPVGDRWVQDLTVVERRADGPHEQSAGGCRFVPLVGAQGWDPQ